MVSASPPTARAAPEGPPIPRHLVILPRPNDDLETARATGIGGTDVPKILGISRWGTPFTVYARKLGLVPPEEAGEEAEAGLVLEPWIIRRWVARTGKPVWTPHATFRVVDRPWELMTPDAISLDGDTIIDAKSRSPFDRKAWGEEGSDDTPEEERVQVEWYCALWGASRWELPVSFDRSVEIFRGAADADFGIALRDEVKAFWHEFIVAQIPPSPLTGEAAAEFVKRRFPRNITASRPATEHEVGLARKWKTLADAIRLADEQKEALENEIKLNIAGAEAIRGEGWSFSWKKTKDRVVIDQEAVVNGLLRDVSLPQETRDMIAELQMKHAETRTGSRAFRPSRIFRID